MTKEGDVAGFSHQNLCGVQNLSAGHGDNKTVRYGPPLDTAATPVKLYFLTCMQFTIKVAN